MSGEKPIRVLHVDDEKSQLEFTKIFLEELDEEVVVDSATSPREALELQEQRGYDCIVSDYKMLSMDGIELARKVREKSGVPFILYTGQGSEEVAESAFEAGIDDYIRKEPEPSHYQVLAKRVRQNVDKYRAEHLYRKVVDESRDLRLSVESVLKELPRRTATIARALMAGYSKSEIAHALGVSSAAVTGHVRKLRTALSMVI